MQEKPQKPALSEALREETYQLKAAWQRHDASFLQKYLIEDVEDPRINLQSILTRHFLMDRLFDDRYAEIMAHEIYFALTVHWLMGLLKSKRSRAAVHMQTAAVLDALLADGRDSDTAAIPPFMAEAFGTLSLPNYISELLMWVPREDDAELMPGYLLETFGHIWAETLAHEQAEPISVIEPACGSANDYRYLAGYGLGPFLDYTGLDIAEKNIVNARRQFPEVNFQVGSVYEIPAEDKTIDFCFVHDLFEHLSPEGIDRAVAEICRVTTQDVCLHFFNMDDIPQDAIRKKDGYHWNRLSSEHMQNRLDPRAVHLDSRCLDTWLKSRFAYPDYHNKYAWSWWIQLQSSNPLDKIRS